MIMEQELKVIEARAARAYDGVFLLPDERTLIRQDVPALVAEVRRLKALLRRSVVVA